MSGSGKKKFLVLYRAPLSVLEAWSQTEPEVRREAETRMRADWDRWMADNGAMILSTEAAGATRRVTSEGVAEAANDVMLCAFVEAATHDDAARAFSGHPHLQIPDASIEITEVRPL